MQTPYFELDCTGKAALKDGPPPPCRDLAICSDACAAGDAYTLRVGETNETLLSIYYPVGASAGAKRAGGAHVDYRTLATLKSKRGVQ